MRIRSSLSINFLRSFLSVAKQCQIYRNRPLSCQKYPIVKTGFYDDMIQLSKCPQKVQFIQEGVPMEVDRLQNFLPKFSRQIQTYQQIDLLEYLQQHGRVTVEELKTHVTKLMNDFMRELFQKK